MRLYERFKAMKFRHDVIGLEQTDHAAAYYCTPRDAQIIGWAGVDGIHYCTIPKFGEMVFAVSPMNFGDCVHPIARSFRDLLCLLLSCGDMAALEQCHGWDEAQYKAFLAEYPVTEQQTRVLEKLRTAFDLQPIDDVFSYVKELQAGFDLSQIPYTEDYYDIDMNPAAPEQPETWVVTYEGGLWSHTGEPGQEISINKTFQWNHEEWLIPAIYLCNQGLVVDYLVKIEPEAMKAFLHKWNLESGEEPCDEELAERIRRDNPMQIDFRSAVDYNGVRLRNDHGSGLNWLPERCRIDGWSADHAARSVLEHYGLDLDQAWVIHRFSYRWGDLNKTEPVSLSIQMIRNSESFTGEHFRLPAAGDAVQLTHPITGERHTLRVQKIVRESVFQAAFCSPDLEYPTNCTVISYTLEPEISDFMLRDCSRGDTPRQVTQDADSFRPVMVAGAAAIGIIGRADGPTAFMTSSTGCVYPNLHSACSALHFEPVVDVEWCPVFHVKMVEDCFVEVI